MPADRERMEASVSAGRMGRMGWMGGSRPAQATDPRRHDPDARSVITVAAPYVGSDRAAWDDRPSALHEALAPVLGGAPAEPAGRIARYAIGSDYHGALRGRLEGLAADLRASGIATGETAYVDDRPLAERALAARGGLGWIGKNTNLLTHERAGSWVFLGAILTSAELPADAPVRTSCGSCTPVPLRLSDRGARRAAHDRRAALHQLSDDRASRRPRRVGGGSHRRLDLRLRRLPGGVPGQCRCRRPGRAPRPAAAAHRVAPPDGHARVRAGARVDRADPRGPSPPAAERGRGARECRSAVGRCPWAARVGRAGPARRGPGPGRGRFGDRDGLTGESPLSLRAMPRVAPFRGLHYSIDRFGGTAVPERVRLADDDDAPPTQARRHHRCRLSAVRRHRRGDAPRAPARDPHNAVRLELSAEPDPHAAAAEALASWTADGTLERRAEPAVYYYRHATAGDPGHADGRGSRRARAARAVGERRPPARAHDARPKGRPPRAAALHERRSSARSSASTSTAPSAITTS